MKKFSLLGSQREEPFIDPLTNQLGTFSQKKRNKFCKLFVNGTMIACVLVKLFERKKRRSQRISPKAAPLYFGIRFSLNGVEKMIGLWYNAVNLLEGELFDDAFK